MDHTHNPEFTVMELYVAYKDYLDDGNHRSIVGKSGIESQGIRSHGREIIDFKALSNVPFWKQSKPTRRSMFRKWLKSIRDRKKFGIRSGQYRGKLIDEILVKSVNTTFSPPLSPIIQNQ